MKATVEEVKARVGRIVEICNKYGFMERTVMPYSFKMTVKELVYSDGWQNYECYEKTSKAIIEDEIEGFEKILNAWVEIEKEPKLQCRVIQGTKIGQIVEYHKSAAEELEAIGLVEVIR
jgi:hypothetical protein